FPRQIRANTISFTVFPEIVPSIGNSFINTMKNINHTRSSISDDIRNILCSSANMRRAIPLILRLLMRSEERFSRNAETDLVCRLLLEKKKETNKSSNDTNKQYNTYNNLQPIVLSHSILIYIHLF